MSQEHTGVLYARDKNAYTGPRTHELADPVTKQVMPFTFPNQYTDIEIPASIAVALIEIDGFEVRNSPDDVYPMKPASEKSREVRYLAPDEVIAKLTDLSRPALMRMAKAMQMTVQQKTTNDEMIQFIMGGDIAETEEHATLAELENE